MSTSTAKHDVEELAPETRTGQAIQIEVPGVVGETAQEEDLVDKVVKGPRLAALLHSVLLKPAVVDHEREGEHDEDGRDDDDGDGGGRSRRFPSAVAAVAAGVGSPSPGPARD